MTTTSQANEGGGGRLMLLFVRHGETQDNIDKILQGWHDTSLTDKGHKEAQIMAEKLRGQPIAHIYHSPLIRMLQTIKPILADNPGVSTQPDPDLRGQGLGELEGGSYELVDMSNPRSADGKPGVELFDDFLARLQRSFARVVGDQAPLAKQAGGGDRNVVVATHGVVITSIFQALEAHGAAIRGPEAYEVRYPDSDDVAKLVALDPANLPITNGVLDWSKIPPGSFLIERWGKKENAIGAK